MGAEAPLIMLAKRIIPCLDVRNGRVVKGVNFEGLRDVDDPVALARFYNDSGADELVFYDITASFEGRPLSGRKQTQIQGQRASSHTRRALCAILAEPGAVIYAPFSLAHPLPRAAANGLPRSLK